MPLCNKKADAMSAFLLGWVPAVLQPSQHLSSHFQPLAVNVVVTRSAIN
jgi:hypothetical protein